MYKRCLNVSLSLLISKHMVVEDTKCSLFTSRDNKRPHWQECLQHHLDERNHGGDDCGALVFHRQRNNSEIMLSAKRRVERQKMSVEIVLSPVGGPANRISYPGLLFEAVRWLWSCCMMQSFPQVRRCPRETRKFSSSWASLAEGGCAKGDNQIGQNITWEVNTKNKGRE